MNTSKMLSSMANYPSPPTGPTSIANVSAHVTFVAATVPLPHPFDVFRVVDTSYQKMGSIYAKVGRRFHNNSTRHFTSMIDNFIVLGNFKKQRICNIATTIGNFTTNKDNLETSC
jgi:hypothetical protein